MSIGSPVAADVPDLFDVIINGQGYLFLRAIDTSLPFRTQRALYTRSATFVERANTSGSYGDNQQDFFLTASQADWSGGEDQRFFRINDDASKTRFWQSTNADISIPGQVKIGPATKTSTFAAAVSGVGSNQFSFFAASTTNLYEYDGTTFTDRGAHGAGGLPTVIAFDGTYVYLAGSSTTAIRRYDTGAHTFSTFNATSISWVTYLNNSLWGSTGSLLYYSTAGVASTAYTWQNAIGGALSNTKRIIPFGGQIMALLTATQDTSGAELWVGDTTGAKRIAELPPNFSERSLTQADGIVFIIGAEAKNLSEWRTCVYYYANGNLGRLWASPTWTTATFGGQDIIPYQGGLIFTDIVSNTIKFYNLVTGAISSVASWTPSVQDVYFGRARTVILMTQNVAGATYLFDSVTASTATISSSLMDFDNSLSKQMRGVKVDWLAGSDGNGGSVDISYQVDSLDGAYTSLQVGAVSGTEYPLSVSGHSISVKITLNKGTSTYGPTLKRVYVRAAPVLQSFRQCEYILDCSGVDSKTPVILNDNQTAHPLDGLQQAQNLQTAIATTSPFSISDRFGTYTGVIEPDKTEIIEVSPEEYIARIWTREV